MARVGSPLILSLSPALADVSTPIDDCADLAEGNACETDGGEAGTCQDGACVTDDGEDKGCATTPAPAAAGVVTLLSLGLLAARRRA